MGLRETPGGGTCRTGLQDYAVEGVGGGFVWMVFRGRKIQWGTGNEENGRIFCLCACVLIFNFLNPPFRFWGDAKLRGYRIDEHPSFLPSSETFSLYPERYLQPIPCFDDIRSLQSHVNNS